MSYLPYPESILATLIVIAAIIASADGCCRTASAAEPAPKLRVPAKTGIDRPVVEKLLTEYELTLAECPCPPDTKDAGCSILVVQEPFLLRNNEQDPSANRCPGSCLVWFLKGRNNRPVEEAAVLGCVFLCSPFETYTKLQASIVFDPERGQYWISLLQGTDIQLRLWVYLVDPQKIAAPSRSASLASPTADWPPPTLPIAGTRAVGDGTTCHGLAGPCSMNLVTPLAAEVKSGAEGATLVLQVHSTDYGKNKHPTVKLWKWHYAIEQKQWSQDDIVDVPRPEIVLTAREKMNHTRREKWASLIHDIEYRNYPKAKEPADAAK